MASSARVGTDRPARYGKQLVAHLGRRSGGEWDDSASAGWIRHADGRTEVSCGDGVLLLSIEASSQDLPRLEDVVGRHLVRFGARDELVVTWFRDDGAPGSEQRLTAEPGDRE